MLLFFILVLIISIPAVQTTIGKKVTKRINKDFGTNINVGRVGLQFNGDVELKDILIKDYQQDTLISANEINTSIIHLKNFIDSKLTFGDIDVENLVFNIKTYKNASKTNLDVFIERFEKDNPTDSTSVFLLSSSDVTITNSTFRIIDENAAQPKQLILNQLNANATNLVIKGPEVNARINTLNFTEQNGLHLENLATNFSYGLEKMVLDNLRLRTKQSEVIGALQFSYNRADFKDFVNKVKVDGTINTAKIATNDLNQLYKEFGANQYINFTTTVNGTLNKLRLSHLNLTTNVNTKIKGTINFENLFNAAENNFSMLADFENLTSNYTDLKNLLPNVLGNAIPSIFEALGTFVIDGKSYISAAQVLADLNMETELGLVASNLEIYNLNNVDKASYKGNISLDMFDLGSFLNDKNLGTVSLYVDVDGSGFTRENINTNISGDVYDLVYNQYRYNNIVVSGDLKNRIFNGTLQVEDPNLKLDFDGLINFKEKKRTFKFNAVVDYINLKELHFIKEGVSEFTGTIAMNMKGSNYNDAVGAITFSKTVYKNKNDTYKFKDFAVESSFTNNIREIVVNSPDIVEGKVQGVFTIENLKALFSNSIGSIYTNYKPLAVQPNQYLDFNFKIYNTIVELFLPEIELGKNTFIKGHVESDEKGFNVTFKSPKIELEDYFANKIEVQIDNKNPIFNTFIEIDSISTNAYQISKFNLINTTVNDTLFMRSEFKGGKTSEDIFNLSIYHTQNEQNLPVVGFKKSDITYKNNKWFINENKNAFNKITFDTNFKNFTFNDIDVTHENEKIKLSGFIKESGNKDLNLILENVDINSVTPTISNLKLGGIANGTVDILQKNGVYATAANATIEQLAINEYELGDFNSKLTGNKDFTQYTIVASIRNDTAKSFQVEGAVDISEATPSITAKAILNDFSLEPLNPFLEGVLSNIRGTLNGAIDITGNLSNIAYNGALQVQNGGLGIAMLNTDYNFPELATLTLKNESILFSNLKMKDTMYNTTGLLNGSISHHNFNQWKLDLNITTNRLLVLNTKED